MAMDGVSRGVDLFATRKRHALSWRGGVATKKAACALVARRGRGEKSGMHFGDAEGSRKDEVAADDTCGRVAGRKFERAVLMG